MDLAVALPSLKPLLLFAVAFAVAANDTGLSVGTVVGARVIPARVALLVAAAVASVAVLLATPPLFGDAVAALLPAADAGSPLALDRVAFIALAATGSIALVAALIGWPVPALLVALGGFLGALGPALEDGALLSPPVIGTVVAVAGLLLGGMVVGAAVMALAKSRLLRAWRPRDRLRHALPLTTGLTAALLVVLTVLAFDLAGPPGMALLAVIGGVALLILIFAYVSVRAFLSDRPFWVTNDADGVDAAHRRLHLAGGFVLAFLLGAYQAIVIAALGGFLLVAPETPLPSSVAAVPTERLIDTLVPVAAGVFAGVLLIGHRSAARVGTGLADATPVRGAAVTLAALVSLIAAGVAGLPLIGLAAVVGAIVGIGLLDRSRGLGVRALVLLAVWVAAPIAAFALAWGIGQAIA